MSHNALPPDPFAGDPNDPAQEMSDYLGVSPISLSEQERVSLLSDLGDLDVYQTLLAPQKFRGVVVECSDCQEPHYHDWELLRESLRQLLEDGSMRPHEPAYQPDPAHYVSWEYCRGYADAVAHLARQD